MNKNLHHSYSIQSFKTNPSAERLQDENHMTINNDPVVAAFKENLSVPSLLSSKEVSVTKGHTARNKQKRPKKLFACSLRDHCLHSPIYILPFSIEDSDNTKQRIKYIRT